MTKPTSELKSTPFTEVIELERIISAINQFEKDFL